MCGFITLFGREIEIPCEEVRFRWPPIDFTQLFGEVEGPQPEPWRTDLTSIGQILVLAGSLNNRDMANTLGTVAAEIGAKIGSASPIDVSFGWNIHGRKRSAVSTAS